MFIIITESPLPPPVIDKYVWRDVRHGSSEADDGKDLAHHVGHAWSSH
jgi:hypothetical protein